MKSQFNPWPYGVIAFFVLLFCGMAAVVVIAATHQDSMVSENYYEQELKFQNQIDSSARATKCGARIDVDTVAMKLLVTVPADQWEENFSGAIDLYRPSSPALDRSFGFQPGRGGVQAINISNLVTGLWLVRAAWTAHGTNYFLEQKFTR